MATLGDTTLKKIVGLAMLVFGGFVFYMADAWQQWAAGGGVMLVALALMFPTAVQMILQMAVGFGRSAGIIKTKPHARTSHPKLAETISAEMGVEAVEPPKPAVEEKPKRTKKTK